jgi:hypothetical protein
VSYPSPLEKSISRRRWTELPITDAVIARVHELTLAEKTYDPTAPNFLFGWATNMPVADVTNENQEQPQLPVLGGANDTNGNDDELEAEAKEEAENGDGEEGKTKKKTPSMQTTKMKERKERPTKTGKDEGAPPQNEQDEEQEDQEASLTVDEVPPAHHHNLRGNQISYDHRFAHRQGFTRLSCRP